MKAIFDIVGIDPEKYTICEALNCFDAEVGGTMKIMPIGKDGKPTGLLLVCGSDDAQKIYDFVNSLDDA